MVTIPYGLKRSIINHHFYWTVNFDTETKIDLEELLGIKLKRKAVKGEWRYSLFPAKKETRLKHQVLNILQPTEEELELPVLKPPKVTELMIRELETEIIKKRQPALNQKVQKIRELNSLGQYDEAEGLYGETKEDLELEVCTLHIRVDYTSKKAKKGHEFYMDNTSVSGEFPKGMTDEEVMELLLAEFLTQFEEEFGFNPLTQMDGMVEGLERGEQKSTGIVINYRHNKLYPYKKMEKEVQTTLW